MSAWTQGKPNSVTHNHFWVERLRLKKEEDKINSRSSV